MKKKLNPVQVKKAIEKMNDCLLMIREQVLLSEDEIMRLHDHHGVPIQALDILIGEANRAGVTLEDAFRSLNMFAETGCGKVATPGLTDRLQQECAARWRSHFLPRINSSTTVSLSGLPTVGLEEFVLWFSPLMHSSEVMSKHSNVHFNFVQNNFHWSDFIETVLPLIPGAVKYSMNRIAPLYNLTLNL